MKIFKGAIALIFAGIAMVSGQAWAAPITVANFSFEAPITGTFSACPITGWTCSSADGDTTQGVFRPTSPANYTIGANGLGGGLIVPDGAQLAYSSGGGLTLSQTTGELIAASATYTINVFVGDRNDTGFPGGSVILTHNGTAIPGATFALTPPGDGQWLNETFSFTTGAINPFPLEFIGIRFVNGGGNQLNLDNVRLDGPNAVPEPTTLMLLGSGLVVLGLFGRHKPAQTD